MIRMKIPPNRPRDPRGPSSFARPMATSTSGQKRQTLPICRMPKLSRSATRPRVAITRPAKSRDALRDLVSTSIMIHPSGTPVIGVHPESTRDPEAIPPLFGERRSGAGKRRPGTPRNTPQRPESRAAGGRQRGMRSHRPLPLMRPRSRGNRRGASRDVAANFTPSARG